MVAAGTGSFRLNSSHLTVEEVEEWLSRLAAEFGPAQMPTIVIDLQGSKWRLGLLSECHLEAGESVSLVLQDADSAANVPSPHTLPVPHPDFFVAAERSSGIVRINDGRVHLAIDSVSESRMEARVLQGGPLGARKGVSLSDSSYRREGLQDQDAELVRRLPHMSWICYAFSYVRDATELRALTADLTGTADGTGLRVIAKVERPEALQGLDDLAGTAEALWVCRGDLGAEVGMAAMAQAVHDVAIRLSSHGPLDAPVLLAGQVLEHMTAHPAPTRAEVCHLYDILKAGFSGVVLSDETAIGKYPVEACRHAALFRRGSPG